MKHKMWHIALWTLLLVLGGCAREADDQPFGLSYDFVELVSSTGSGATFHLYPPGSSQPALLTSPAPVDTKGKPAGTYFLMAYTADDHQPYTSKTIEVESLSAINNIALRVETPADLRGWDRQSVYLYSLWASGSSVLLDVGLTYQTDGRDFGLVADETTLDGDTPQLYLMNRPALDKPNFSRRYYVATNLSSLWERPQVKQVDIHISNANLTDLTIITISRPLP